LVVPGDGGYGVLKDRSPDKPFEYLVIPTAPVCGIEDPVLQEGRGPGYLKGAWQARGLLRVPHDTRPAQMVGVTIDTLEHVKAMLRERLGADIPDDAIGLAVNGRTARAQDQLHIHIGCLKASVRDALRRHPPGAAWGRVPEPLNGHAFFARSVSAAAWPGVNPFRELRALVGSDSAMNGAGLVVAGAPSGGFYVLASQAAVEAAGVDRGTGFGEGLLDHSCGVAGE
jgi:CDP-diacylglycerol pyrophosphatase